jgi:hypothetical protein
MDWPMGYDGAEIRVWAESAASSYSWPLLAWAAGTAILLLLVVLVVSFPARRRFWCEQAGREVDVEFEEDGPPLLRRFTAVVSCTAFQPSTQLRCDRACLARDVASLELRRPA